MRPHAIGTLAEMSSETARAPRQLIVIDQNLKDLVGHHFEYDRSVSAAARREGLSCSVLCAKGAELPEIEGLRVVPVFSADIWSVKEGLEQGSGYHSPENIRHQSAVFARDALGWFRRHRLRAGDVVFAHMLTRTQLPGMVEVIRRLRGSGARFVLMLRYDRGLYDDAICARAFRALEKLARKADVSLCTDSHRLAREHGSLTTLPFDVYPIPHTDLPMVDRPESGPRPAGAPLRVVSLGNARGEKGFGEILEAITIAERRGVDHRFRFVLQANDPSADVADSVESFDLASHPSTEFINEALDTADYYALLGSADIILLPYHRAIYHARTSGVFLEAVAAGKPVVCTSDTWMGELLGLHGNGLCCSDGSAADLLVRLLEIADDYDAFTARARAAREDFAARHTADVLVAHLLGRDAPSVEPPRGSRAVVLFPWGNGLEVSSGATVRLSLLTRYLERHFDEIRVLHMDPRRGRLSSRTSVEGFDITGWEKGWLQRWLDRLNRFVFHAEPGQLYHLWHHLWPRLDHAFHLKVREMVGWADDIYLEYTYFAPVVERACRELGKSYHLTDHDIVSDQSRDKPLLHALTHRLEFEGLKRAPRLVVTTESDALQCTEAGADPIVIPNPVDQDGALSASEAEAVLLLRELYDVDLEGRSLCFFIGSAYQPNREAAAFIRELAARTRERDPESELLFVVAGSCMAPCAEANFRALGRIDELSLSLAYAHASVVLVPLTHATGQSIKTVEALARGALMLTTSLGARGIGVQDGVHCVIDDDLSRWGDRIAHMLAMPESEKIAMRARAREFGPRFHFEHVFDRYQVAFERRLPDPPPIPGFESPDKTHAPYLEVLTKAVERRSLPALELARERLEEMKLPGEALLELASAHHALCPESRRAQVYLDRAELSDCDALELALARCRIFDAALEPEAIEARSVEILSGAARSIARSPARWRERCWDLFFAGEYAQVRAICRVMLEAGRDDDADVHYLLAHAAHSSGETGARVLAHYDRALELGFDEGWTRFHRGRLLLERGEPSGRSDLERARALGGDAGEAAATLLERDVVDRLWSRFHAGDLDAVERGASQALKRCPEDAGLHYLLGHALHLRERELESALTHYDQAFALGMEPGWINYHRGRLRLALGDSAGREDLELSAAVGDESSALARKALQELGEADRDDALREARRLDEDASTAPLADQAFASHAARVREGEGETVLCELKRELAREPTSPRLHYLLARALDETGGQLERTLWHYDEALAYGYDAARVRLARGARRCAAGLEIGRTDLRQARQAGGDAGEQAAALLEIEAGVDETLRSAGRGHLEEALERATKLLEQQPAHALLHFVRGRLLEVAGGDEQLVLDLYDRAIAIGLTEPAVHYRRGRLRLATSRPGGLDDLLLARPRKSRLMQLGGVTPLREAERTAIARLAKTGAHRELKRLCELMLRELPGDGALRAHLDTARQALGEAPPRRALSGRAGRAARAFRRAPPTSV